VSLTCTRRARSIVGGRERDPRGHTASRALERRAGNPGIRGPRLVRRRRGERRDGRGTGRRAAALGAGRLPARATSPRCPRQTRSAPVMAGDAAQVFPHASRGRGRGQRPQRHGSGGSAGSRDRLDGAVRSPRPTSSTGRRTDRAGPARPSRRCRYGPAWMANRLELLQATGDWQREPRLGRRARAASSSCAVTCRQDSPPCCRVSPSPQR
jgi:hypothetical protein